MPQGWGKCRKQGPGHLTALPRRKLQDGGSVRAGRSGLSSAPDVELTPGRQPLRGHTGLLYRRAPGVLQLFCSCFRLYLSHKCLLSNCMLPTLSQAAFVLS